MDYNYTSSQCCVVYCRMEWDMVLSTVGDICATQNKANALLAVVERVSYSSWLQYAISLYPYAPTEGSLIMLCCVVCCCADQSDWRRAAFSVGVLLIFSAVVCLSFLALFAVCSLTQSVQKTYIEKALRQCSVSVRSIHRHPPPSRFPATTMNAWLLRYRLFVPVV